MRPAADLKLDSRVKVASVTSIDAVNGNSTTVLCACPPHPQGLCPLLALKQANAASNFRPDGAREERAAAHFSVA